MTDDLKKLAEAALTNPPMKDGNISIPGMKSQAAFRAAANPAAILNLIRERDEAREEVERLKKQITSTALDALAADGQAHESYAAAMALHERLTAILDWCDLAADQPSTFNQQGVKLLQGPVFDDARKAIADHAIYAPKEPHHV